MEKKISSIKKNITFNYLGQFYSTFIGIIVLPLFLVHMGPEAYGLVGFFTLIQAWLSLLDVGMTPTLGREIARLKNKTEEHWRLLTVVNSLEVIFSLVAILVSLFLFLSREWIASSWLTIETLEINVVTSAISMMAITIGLKWVASLNRSGINAYEHQVWMNFIDIIINTLRFPGALLLIIYTNGDILSYFYFQLFVVLIEVTIIRSKFRRLLPYKNLDNVKVFSFKEIQRVAPFTLSIGYTAAIWVLLTQLDKLLLSKYLPLSEFGYFTLIGIVVNGMTMLANPITKALLPRMTALLSDGKDIRVLSLYQTATRLISTFIFPLGLVIVFNSQVVVYAWTGNELAAAWVEPIMPLFILGAMALSVVSLPYILQYAYGELKYHVRWNTFSLIINVPLIIYMASVYGAVGVGWVWLCYRLFALIVWTCFIHNKFAPGIHVSWFFKGVVLPFLVAIIVTMNCRWLFPLTIEMSRLYLITALSLFSITTMIITGLISFKFFSKS